MKPFLLCHLLISHATNVPGTVLRKALSPTPNKEIDHGEVGFPTQDFVTSKRQSWDRFRTSDPHSWSLPDNFSLTHFTINNKRAG